MDEQAIITLSIEGTKLLLRGSKEVLAALVAAIRYSADKMIPARKCRDFLTSTSEVRFISMSDEAIEKTSEVASNMTYLELSTHPGYMDAFVAACFIPHTDRSLFPSCIQA